MALISWEYVQRILHISDSQQEQTELLIGWITRRGETIARRELESKERTVYLSGYGGSELILPHWPVKIVASVIISGNEITDFSVDERKGIIYRKDATFPKGERNIEVTYTAGWSDITAPDDVKLACLEAISWNLKRFNDGAMGVKNQTTPDGVNVGYELVLPLSVQRVFESYKSVGV
jgi:hypothetical protein